MKRAENEMAADYIGAYQRYLEGQGLGNPPIGSFIALFQSYLLNHLSLHVYPEVY